MKLSNIIFSQAGPALSPEDLAAFEQEIEGRLPDDYKQFLLAQNGGMTDPPLGLLWGGKERVVLDFRRLVSIDDGGLRRALANLRELRIDGYLPVTSTLNQDDICLDFKNEIGTIWFAQYAYNRDVAVDVSLSRLASSFSELCDILIERPEPYCRIEDLGKRGTEADLEQYVAEGSSIDTLGRNGYSIVCEAIKYGNLAMIEACIARGASLSQTIHLAACNKRPDLIRRFAAAGADVNEPDSDGEPPMNYVCGTALPGEEGSLNRAVRDTLLDLGARRIGDDEN